MNQPKVWWEYLGILYRIKPEGKGFEPTPYVMKIDYDRVRAALDLALYYIEGDSTYKSVKVRVEAILNEKK
jgi:hypothetical protein